MKCPKCYCVDSRVKETRVRDSGIITRRRRCADCGADYTTMELPPGAGSYVQHALTKWEKRQVGRYKVMLRQRQLLAARMREWRKTGLSVEAISAKTGLSVAMVYYYTAPSKEKR